MYLHILFKDDSCSKSRTICANEGSSTMLTLMYDLDIYHNNNKMDINKPANKRILNNCTINNQINNVTPEDEGFYECTTITNRTYTIRQNVANSGRYITQLKLKANGYTIATGNNETVMLSYIPDRTHHLTTYTCIDSTLPSIKTTALLRVNYSPDVTIRFKGETIDCECDGVPEVYNPYRLDHISEYGELIDSVNLNNGNFILHKKPSSYQQNGKYRCVVSNGIPDVSGHVLQIQSKIFKYKGPPVFALENRNVRFWEQGQSMTMTFKVYSNPEVKDVFIYKLGHKQTQAMKITNFTVFNSTLLYTEFDLAGIKGFAIVIEKEVLTNDDFQSYRITASNQLGASDYHFEIINEDNLPVSRGKMTYFVMSCCVTGVLLVTVCFIYTCSCMKRQKTKSRIELLTSEARSSHSYDDIVSVSYQPTRNVLTFNTNRNPIQSSTLLCESSMYHDVNPNTYQNIERITTDESR
ncbi:unnamed protein product [Mytilus coruscus]|uniref:Ig-like domain-containing protein n=1 Tax=Mytilus coruscus TaxID=42192 RepID=A0A6J8EP54_MYTCO|nr:unnamed protein product [Mytilus coruscus]